MSAPGPARGEDRRKIRLLRKAKKAGQTREQAMELIGVTVRSTAARERWRTSETVMALAAWTTAVRAVFGDD